MLDLIVGAVITLLSILIGYNLGKNQSVVTPDFKKQVNQIFRRVVPDKEIGIIERPTAQQNFYRDNPQAAKENEIMEESFNILNKEV